MIVATVASRVQCLSLAAFDFSCLAHDDLDKHFDTQNTFFFFVRFEAPGGKQYAVKFQQTNISANEECVIKFPAGNIFANINFAQSV